jgi:uncharacterized protein (DUF427 family)
MKTPGPDHPISIEAHPRRVVVRFAGLIVVDTTRALVLREASYPAVFYLPREDAQMRHLVRSEHRTHCPYKGDASYFTLEAGGKKVPNAVWSYEEPYPAVTAIKDRLAFYPNRVDAIEEFEP